MKTNKLFLVLPLLFVLFMVGCDSDSSSSAQPMPMPMPTPFPMQICPCDPSQIQDLVDQAHVIDCVYNLFTIDLTALDAQEMTIGVMNAGCNSDGTNCGCSFGDSSHENITLEEYNNCFWRLLDDGVSTGSRVNKIGQCETNVVP